MTTEAPQLAVGDTVRFREVVEPGDDRVRFTVRELRGDRVLVEDVCDLPIKPTCVYPVADLVRVDD